MTYTTISGDTWDIIAYKLYGIETMADRLMAVNHRLLDYFVFPAGVVLDVPEVEQEAIDGLPPWMTAG